MSWKKDFALCSDNCTIKKIQETDNGKTSVNLYRGMMVQIYEKLPNKKCSVKVCDFHGELPIFAENLFVCSLNSLLVVSSDLWPFLIGINEPLHRLELAKDRDRANFIMECNTDHIVQVLGGIFGREQPFTCIIRFIGLVPEMGPGYYFGLEILTLENGYSPQADVFDFIPRYVSCEQNLALIVSASHIRPIPKDKRGNPETFLKRSVNGLTCGAVEIAKSLDRHITSKLNKKPHYNSSNHHHQHDKCSPPQSRSSFYVVPDINVIKSISTEHLASTPGARVLEHDNTRSTMTDRSKKVAISKSTPNLDKQDSGSSTGSSGHKANLQNEDFVRHVENYERNLEKKRNRRTSGTTSSVKTNTIMSLADRDLIIIDNTDIKEAIGNHSDVIIVDPPPPPLSEKMSQSELDLKDILGENWPTLAGDMAPLLNNEKKASIVRGAGSVCGSSTNSSSTGSSNYLKFERNKSLNPVSHIVSTTKPVKDRRDFSAPTEYVNGYHKRSNSNHLDSVHQHHVLPTPIVDMSEPFIPTPLKEIPGTGLGLGSMVEVATDICENLYGVIRWIGSTQTGTVTATNHNRIIVGVELEDDQTDRPLELTDGVYSGMRLFRCPPGRALFVHPSQCTNDRRFADVDHHPVYPVNGTNKTKPHVAPDPKQFGQVDCPIVEGSISPLQILKHEDLDALCGKFKGIQGHHNSCYLDATLFAMFTFTSVFDSLLYRPRESEDNMHYDEVQKVLREEIVNPLRKNMFVRADRVMKLRQLLDKLSSVTGLTNEEKDPEEFLNCLLAQIMRAEPFLKLSSGLDAFYYQLFVEKDERLNLPSVQQLFEQSFLQSDIKLKEVPSCLIIQMPRFGKSYKMYPRILPSQVLDVTDVIEDSPRQCTVCGKLAEYECRECFGMLQCGVGLECTSFCKKCLETAHSHTKRLNHKPNPLQIPQDFKIMAEHCPVPRLFMELFAVVCIETSHYVAFVKAGSGSDAPWCFFDSMADRKGEQNGYNIPEMVPVPDLHQWLSEDGARALNELSPSDKMLPEHARRLFCDAYMCMYQSTDVMMYR